MKRFLLSIIYLYLAGMLVAQTAKAVISGGHTTFIYIAMNENVLLDKQQATAEEEGCRLENESYFVSD